MIFHELLFFLLSKSNVLISGRTTKPFSIFDFEGSRDICLINVDGTGFTKLTNHPADDRYPAYSPDGKKIAFISYRTGIPNLFLKNLSTGKIYQLTDTPGGVFNPAWLPDGKHIALIVFEDRNKTDINVLPAEKFLTVADETSENNFLKFHKKNIPNSYNTSLPISKNKLSHKSTPYNSIKNIRSQILLPYSDKNEDRWQYGMANLFADPLEKHTLLTTMTYGNRLHFSADYLNTQFNPTFELNINKATINHGNFLRINEKNVTLPLYENYYSGSASLYWLINFGRTQLSNHHLWLRQTVTYRNSINFSDYEKMNIADLAIPFQGWVNYLTFGYSWQAYRPDISFDIHPKSGHVFNIYSLCADSWFKSDLIFTQLNVSGLIRQQLPFLSHVLAARIGGSFRNGEQPLQSRMSISGLTIRGLNFSREGDQQLFSNIEYRFPLIRDFGLKLWILYFEQFCGTLFFDSGKAWGSDFLTFYDGSKTKFSSVDWVQTTGIELRHRLYLLGKIPIVISGGFGFNTRNTKEANFYFRLGPVF